MAQIPTPRSYSEILGDLIDAFLSHYGLRALKIGSPVLSMFESVAQSQLRSSEDIFTLLEATSLDQAKGVALDRIGADESVARETENPATGVVTIGDASFAKISSKVFQGTPAPIVGSVRVNVTDASLFPASGNVYVGRSTSNFEGPLTYTSKLPPGVGGGQSGGNYWALVLSSGTQRFHNLGESVIVAQGGDRDINAGTIVQTPQGNVVNAVQFRTLYKATIPDGEVVIDNVAVVALKPGVSGNVPAAAINGWNGGGTGPFNGASVTNPQPYTNGVATETDDSYRERIRQARASRVRGTALALQTFSVGVTSPTENKRVLSASVVARSGAPTVLYVDDGTGYEMASEGVAIESFTSSATAGDDFFKISAPIPVTKAFVLSTEVAPFTLSAGCQWAFKVGGVTTTHTVSDDGSFRSIGNATSYEWVASVNANPALNWSARTYANGTKVAVFAKADTNESIQYDPAAVTTDGNAFTSFGLGRVDTMRLYRNDRLLNKDGSIASIVSNAFALWAPMGPTEDLQLAVDGAPLANLVSGTFTFTASDFINAATGYTTVGRNSPAAWAKVFNYRIPGITATVVNGLVVITSNLGASSRASLNVVGGSLTTKAMFAVTALPVVGASSDYVLDRNTGELKLTNALALGDNLSAGSVNTRAFLESPALGAVTISGTGAHLWFASDSNATLVPHGLTASTPINITSSATSWGFRERFTSAGALALFGNVKVGDWAIFWDAAVPADIRYRAFRVAAVDVAFTWFEIERFSVTAASNPVTFAVSGLTVVRTPAQLQPVTIGAAANYTASSLAPLLNAAFVGAQATVYRTQALRVNTTTFNESVGDVGLVGSDVEGLKLGFAVSNPTQNITGHLASIESGGSEIGVPDFHQIFTVSGAGIGTQPTVDWGTTDPLGATPSVASLLVGLRPIPHDTLLTGQRYGESNGAVSPLSSVTDAGGGTYALVLRNLPYEIMLKNRWYLASPYRLTPDDSATFLIDGDTETKRFVVPMWRTLKTVGTTYATTNTFKDADNGNQSMGVGFGYTPGGFDFNDFAVFMAARVKTHDQGDAVHYTAPPGDLTKTILWRYFRLGSEGNQARVRYFLPSAANAPVGVTVDSLSGSTTDISVVLAGGALRTGYALAATSKIGVVVTASASGISNVNYLLGLATSTAQRTTNVTTITVNLAASGATDHNFQTNDQIFVKNNNATYPDGAYLITRISATQFSYADAGANAGPTAIVGTASYGTAEATLTGSSPAVTVGNILYVGPTTAVGANFVGTPMRIDTLSDAQTMKGVLPATLGVNTVVTWASVNDVAAVAIYANATQTATVIAAAVNALAAAANSKCPVKATVIGSGAGTIDKASYAEAASATTQWFNLTDGINHIQTTTVPAPAGDYSLTFKSAISAGLATNSDWANEVVRVVPRTAKNVVDWLNAPTVSGLFSATDIERSSNGRKVQLASLTPGSGGSIEVQGGTANAVTAAVLGSAAAAGSTMVASIRSTDVLGLTGGAWVSIDNTETLPKAVFTSATTLQAITNVSTNSNIQIGTTSFYTRPHAAVDHLLVSIERQGNFWAITDTSLGAALATGTLAEGDYVSITASPSPTHFGVGGNEAVSNIAAGNTGIFRVVRVVPTNTIAEGGASIWIENTSGVVQDLCEARIDFFTADSVMPGDYISISTPLWNGAASNQGRYQVVSVGDGGSGAFTNAAYVQVAGTLSPVGVPTAALGTSAQLVQVIEGTPARMIKKIWSIAPNQTDGTLYDVKFTTSALVGKVGATPGSVITLLDKLGFAPGVNSGVDGYQHTVGLIAEVAKVIQGDPSDDATYPGVAAAGATVNIQGPLVKRIQVTLSVRVRSGAPTQDIEARVKSAVASVINKTPVGQAISLSDLTTAAGKVGGVISAVMVKPVAAAGADLIAVQAYEKPLVLNVDQDILVSFAGD